MGGGSRIDDDCDLADSVNAVSTVVLVGKTGNGKSATGNTILGRKAFKSKFNSGGVTTSCEMQSTILKDGRIVNVIDTPGLFDSSEGSQIIGKEIVKCVGLAKDGIHGVLIVLSVRSRFSKEEEAAIHSLQTIFGEKITEYMIIVFTGGDNLEGDDMTLEDYIGSNCPEPLQKFFHLCGQRMVLFDNGTKDVTKRAEQVGHLLSLVDSVVAANGGQPFSDQHLTELKVEEKLKESVERLEKQLADEQAARLEAVKIAQEAQTISDEEIRKLRENLESARKESEEIRKRAEQCAIL